MASLTRFCAMVSLSDLEESSWFQAQECEEIDSSTSVVPQSSMVQVWANVLRRRAVAHIGASQASRRRAVRLVRMAERRHLALSGNGGKLPESSGEVFTCTSRVSYDSASVDDSEDEPLSRRAASYSGFRPSTFDVPSISIQSEGEVESGQEGSSGSEESECEDASEEDSESDSADDSEDDLIYMGRESAISNFRYQAFLARWVDPVARAVEIQLCPRGALGECGGFYSKRLSVLPECACWCLLLSFASCLRVSPVFRWSCCFCRVVPVDDLPSSGLFFLRFCLLLFCWSVRCLGRW